MYPPEGGGILLAAAVGAVVAQLEGGALGTVALGYVLLGTTHRDALQGTQAAGGGGVVSAGADRTLDIGVTVCFPIHDDFLP